MEGLQLQCWVFFTHREFLSLVCIMSICPKNWSDDGTKSNYSIMVRIMKIIKSQIGMPCNVMMMDNGNHRLRIIHCQGVTRPDTEDECCRMCRRWADNDPLDIDINQRDRNRMMSGTKEMNCNSGNVMFIKESVLLSLLWTSIWAMPIFYAACAICICHRFICLQSVKFIKIIIYLTVTRTGVRTVNDMKRRQKSVDGCWEFLE